MTARPTFARVIAAGLAALVLAGAAAPAAAANHDQPSLVVDLHADGSAAVTATFTYDLTTDAERSAFRTLADMIQERFGTFELLSVNQVETTGEALGSGQLGRVLRNELTAEQLTVLRTAHRMGYFDVPREASADDIAAELEIAQSTLSERLRLAEKQLFDLVFLGDQAASGGDEHGS